MKRWLGSLVVVLSASLFGCDSGEGGDDESMAAGSSSGAQSSDGAPGPTGDGSPDPTVATSGGSSDSGGDDSGAGDSGGDDTGADDGNANCCLDHAEAGCNEPLVEQCVCEADAACCVFEWDLNCSQLAEQRCGAECVDGPRSDVGCEPDAFQLTPDQAQYSGDWGTTMSQVGEGTVSFVTGGSAGAVTYSFDIPCGDTWYVWVRYFDNGEGDAYFVRVDGEPNERAVFEGDCTPEGEGYGWRLLNWRDPDAATACTYLEDPWTFQWPAGEHQIEFSLLDSRALGRIVLTNSPEFHPDDYR